MQQELKGLQEGVASREEVWAEKERELEAQRQGLEERLQQLTSQNDVLHTEAEKVWHACTPYQHHC